MAGPARPDVGRVRAHVHVNRALQAVTAILEQDRIDALRNPVDGLAAPVDAAVVTDDRQARGEDRLLGLVGAVRDRELVAHVGGHRLLALLHGGEVFAGDGAGGFEQVGGNEPVRSDAYLHNRHLKWFEGTRKGYAIIEFTPDGVTNTYRVVDTVEEDRSGVSTLAAFHVPRGGTVEHVAVDSANPLGTG